jgi:Tol biopolymer transport system component
MGAPAQAKAPGQNGRIAFGRERPPAGDGSASYTISANGAHLRRLIAGKSDFPRWSPNGARISLGDMGCQFDGTCAAVIVDPDTGGTRVLRNPDPRRFSGVFCDTWSPDGARLACGAEGDAAGSSGVYTLRSSNGGGLQKVVGCDAFGPGGECGPVDYSPDGRRLLLMGPDRRGDTELFLVKSNGGGLHQVTPDGTLVDGNDSVASWSPRGNRILFGGYTDENHRRSIFMVNTDGTRLHQVPIPGCGSARSAGTAVACFNPAWSPNAARIVFSRTTVSPSGRIVSNIYTADPDGSHVVQVTHESNGLQVTAADWGPRRPASSG